MKLLMYLLLVFVSAIYSLMNEYYAAIIPLFAGAFIAIVYSSNKRYKYLDNLIDANF